jgi:hypothetical protein
VGVRWRDRCQKQPVNQIADRMQIMADPSTLRFARPKHRFTLHSPSIEMRRSVQRLTGRASPTAQ